MDYFFLKEEPAPDRRTSTFVAALDIFFPHRYRYPSI
jgi:hypothetical protein